MKLANRLSAVFALLAVVLILGTVALCFLSLDASAILVGGARQAEARTEALMEAICQGDDAAAGSMLQGQPALDSGRSPESSLGQLLWEAYRGSIAYEFSGSCYASDSGLCRDVTVTALDIPAVMQQLKADAQTLLNKHAASSDSDEVYEDDGSYREEFVMDVLCDGAKKILKQEQPLTSHTITLQLTCRDGQWYVLPDPALIHVLAGGMAK